MDYNSNIPNIYEYNAYSFTNKDYILKIKKIDLKKLLKEPTYIYKHNTLFILIKTNIDFGELRISDIKIYNNLIFFPEENLTVRITSSLSNNFNDIDLDQYFLNLYIIIYENNFLNLNKNFIGFDDDDYRTYCTGDKEMLIFDQNNNIMTFTININLYDTNIKSYIKFDKRKLNLIKLKSHNFIFIYNPIIINDKNIVLYLIGIQKIDSGESIVIDIKFNNIDNIYDKYRKSINLIKKFMGFQNCETNIENFFERRYRKFLKFPEYFIEIKYLEKYIRGVYYPYNIYVK